MLGTDDAGRVTFVMVADGTAAADLNVNEMVAAIAGQLPPIAAAYLDESLPLREVPTIDIWPVWFNRIPYTASRIQMEVVP